MIKYIILIAFGLFVAVATLCRPDFLAHNSFLAAFVSHEILALLAVVMTITFASVANIHFALNRIIGHVYAKDLDRGQRAAAKARGELNTNAWTLFWAFIACALILVIKGIVTNNDYVTSAMNGLALGALLVNVLVFYDIYDTLFTLASSDLAVKGEVEADNGE